MAKYAVTVDYVTTATIVVEAPDEETAEAAVESQFECTPGINRLLGRMARNYPDGFSIELVEEADEDADVDIMMAPAWSD